MLKETEETIVFFVTFLSLIAFQLGGPGPPAPPPPLATPMHWQLLSSPVTEKTHIYTYDQYVHEH